MMNKQKRWDRYCNAINFCIYHGIEFLELNESSTGNIKSIKVRWNGSTKTVIIKLKAKKYSPIELYTLIINTLGFKSIKEID